MGEPFPASPESLRRLFRELDFRPRKGLGQNFLVQEPLAHRLVEALGPAEESVVLEIGGGFGILSGLLAGKAKQLVVFEPDLILYDFLKRHLDPSVLGVKGDICKSDFSRYAAPSEKLKVIGNLPYASTSAILLHLVNQRRWIEKAVVTLQREVAERCLATPGHKSYSPLTCAIQYAAEVEKLFLIPPQAFYPKPQVTSCAIQITFLSKPRVDVSDEPFFFKVVRTAFGKRRKQLVNSLAGSQFPKTAVADALKKAGIDPRQRAEGLTLEEFARLSEILRSL